MLNNKIITEGNDNLYSEPNKFPKVSVLLPTFNEVPDVLNECVRSLLDQSLINFECIVIDDSTDLNLANYCKNLCASDSRFHYYHPSERLGLVGSLNLAISKARGEYIVRFDSDDVCLAERFAEQTQFMDSNLNIGVLGGAIEIINKFGVTHCIRLYPLTHIKISKGFHFTTCLAHPTVMFRSSLVKLYGGYDEFYRYAEDLDMWLRWLNRGVIFANLPIVLIKYRQVEKYRSRVHWIFNLCARIRNLSFKFFFRRILGIICICLLVILPLGVQKVFFRIFLTKITK